VDDEDEVLVADLRELGEPAIHELHGLLTGPPERMDRVLQQLAGQGTACLRAFDYTTSTPLGTQSCLTSSTPGIQPSFVFATPEFGLGSLASGSHQLGLQLRFDGSNPCSCDFFDTRIDIDW